MPRKLKEQTALQHEHYMQRIAQREPMPTAPPYAGFSVGLHPEAVPHTTEETTVKYREGYRHYAGRAVTLPPQQQRPRLPHDDVFDDVIERPASSARRYRTTVEPTTRGGPIPPITRRQSMKVQVHDHPRTPPRTTAPAATRSRWSSFRAFCSRHPALTFVLGVSLMGSLFLSCNAGLEAWNGYQLDAQYGRPRTAHYDVVVHHQDDPQHPTHLIALNLHRHIEVIEMPGGDATHTRIYDIPVVLAEGQELAPVTLSFHDVNGDGAVDMIIQVGQDGQPGTVKTVWLNDPHSPKGPQFRPAGPQDHLQMPGGNV